MYFITSQIHHTQKNQSDNCEKETKSFKVKVTKATQVEFIAVNVSSVLKGLIMFEVKLFKNTKALAYATE